MNVSVLITSFNRRKYFISTWPSIRQQLIDGDELVVVEDGHTDEWRDFLDSLNIKYTYVKTTNDRYRSGSKAKNIGLRQAENPIIIINDPEVIHITPCITEMRKRLQENDKQFLVAGTLYQGQFEGQDYTKAPIMKHSQAPFVGAVMKQHLIDIGGWDERFVYWGNDDNDLMDRLGMIGVKHTVLEDEEIYHQWHPRPPQNALGDFNEPYLYEKDKPAVANEGKEWGSFTGIRYSKRKA